MKSKVNISIIVTVLFYIISVIITAGKFNNNHYSDRVVQSNKIISTDDEIELPKEEMRGLWVSYLSLNMGEDTTFEAFANKFDRILADAEKMKCNTIIVQVRPFCDALYYSDIFPASHILSGTQGVSPGYDALEYMCKTTHEKNMRIHAWINPYRIKSATIPEKLSDDHPIIFTEGIIFSLESGMYLNPADKTVRKLITDGVVEIIENYDVDGIQFDDYFYPTDIGDEDNEDYNSYKKSVFGTNNLMSKEDWRISNVNLLISEVYKEIKKINENIVFGISPQGNIRNCYEISADVKRWCESYGYADYICPQIYYSLDNPALRFEDSLKEWKSLSYHKNMEVYVGLAVYKAGSDSDNGTWKDRNNILAKELELLREYGFNGYMLYDYNAMQSKDTKEELDNLLNVIDNLT